MNSQARMRSVLIPCLQALLLAGLTIPLVSGCAALGLAAQALPRPTVPPKYTNLRGQSVAVMVWVERGARTDWPELRLDLANGIQQQLQKAANDKLHDLEGSQFPLTAAAVVQMQDDHPEWAADGIEEVAARLGVSRVIYIEVENFQTRSDASVELFRGSITGRLTVVEVTNGKGRATMTEDNLKDVFPRKGPEEGSPNKNDYDIYRETIKAFTTHIANLFIPHEAEED